MGASRNSVLKWENGQTKPAAAMRVKIIAARQLGRRDARLLAGKRQGGFFSVSNVRKVASASAPLTLARMYLYFGKLIVQPVDFEHIKLFGMDER